MTPIVAALRSGVAHPVGQFHCRLDGHRLEHADSVPFHRAHAEIHCIGDVLFGQAFDRQVHELAFTLREPGHAAGAATLSAIACGLRRNSLRTLAAALQATLAQALRRFAHGQGAQAARTARCGRRRAPRTRAQA
jgi:hypothetical protein